MDSNDAEKARLDDYRVTFATPAGKRVLEDLENRYLHFDCRPHVVAGNETGVVWVDGQRFLVTMIKKWATRPIMDNLPQVLQPVAQGDPLHD